MKRQIINSVFSNRILLFFVFLLLLAFTIGDSKSNYTIPLSAYSVTTADLDLDGDKDIICGHNVNTFTQWSGFSVLLNNGDGTFILDDSIFLYSWQTHIYGVNVNASPNPEIIARHYENGTNFIAVTEYFEGNYFTNYNEIPLGIGGFNVGKIDSNLFTDIVVFSTNSDIWGIMYNDGNGNFFEPEYFNADYPTDIKCGNLNNDIYDDIVIGGSDVYIILPNGSGFENIVFPDGYYDIFIDDFDFDGDNDIVEINGMYTWNFFSFIENQGDNYFIQRPDTTTHPGGHNFFVTDLNNDDFSEIIFVDNNMYGVCIYYNIGDFHLSQPVYIQVEYYGESSRGIHCDDLDGNGYNDIIVIRKYGAPLPANLTILFNDGNGNFLENPVTSVNKPTQKDQNPVYCYPNPFNNKTQICFRLTEESNVCITVYDYTGKEVSIINPGVMASGNHSVEFNSDHLSSGIYFYSLEVNGLKTDTKKMTLMR